MLANDDTFFIPQLEWGKKDSFSKTVNPFDWTKKIYQGAIQTVTIRIMGKVYVYLC